jgi:hypothetical protein
MRLSNNSAALRTLPSALCALCLACTLSPLNNKIEVGREPVIVLAGESKGQTDLFALAPAGGEAVRVTFTRMKESAPALHPAGTSVAFLRRPETAIDSSPATFVVLNLLNTAERTAELPTSIGVPRRIGWNVEGSTVYVLGDLGIAQSAAPPAALEFTPVEIGDARWAAADSATSVLLGDPPVARVETCARDCITAAAKPWCVVSPDGTRQELGRVITPFRWGSDSLAWFEADRLLVYAMAGGRPRRIEWTSALQRPREGSYWKPND